MSQEILSLGLGVNGLGIWPLGFRVIGAEDGGKQASLMIVSKIACFLVAQDCLELSHFKAKED